MKGKDLHVIFLNYLHLSYPSKKELTDILADILKIDRESIARRINGKVLFTVKEVGKIADKLNISIDYLLSKQNDSIFLPLNMTMPQTMESADDFVSMFYNDTHYFDQIKEKTPIHIGYLFDTLPVEFSFPYQHLHKYLCFRNMILFIKNQLFEKYSIWQIPEKIIEHQSKLITCFQNSASIFYIWNNPVIWNLMKDIKFTYKLRMINYEEVEKIKTDLHKLLDDLLAKAKEVTNDADIIKQTPDLYISNININFSCGYFNTPTETLIQYHTPVPYYKLCKNTKEFHTVYNWLHSMKKLSVLISNSAIIQRNLFFEEQHEIIDAVME